MSRLSIISRINESCKSIRFDVNFILVLIIIWGIILRIVTYWTADFSPDGSLYAIMGKSFSRSPNIVELYSNYKSASILYPLYLSGFYYIFGYSVELTRIAAISTGIMFIGVVYLCTKNLYGQQKGLIVASIFSLEALFIRSLSWNCAENFIGIFFVATIWALIKSIERDRYILLVALFGLLFFLSKSSMGAFIVPAIFAIFLWKFYYMRFQIFKRKPYIILMSVIALSVFVFILVNIILLWDGSLNSILMALNPNRYLYGEYTSGILNHLDLILYNMLIGLPFFLLLLSIYGNFWFQELTKGAKKFREEHTSLLWLCFIGISFITWAFLGYAVWCLSSGIKLWYNPDTSVRYLSIGYIPLMWLAVKEVDFDFKKIKNNLQIKNLLKNILWIFKVNLRERKRLVIVAIMLSASVVMIIIFKTYLAIFIVFGAFALCLKSPENRLWAMLAVFLIVCTNATLVSINYGDSEAMKTLNDYVKDGDIVAFHNFTTHRGAYLEKDVILTQYSENSTAKYIVSSNFTTNYAGYRLISEYSYYYKKTITSELLTCVGLSSNPKDSGEIVITLWQRTR